MLCAVAKPSMPALGVAERPVAAAGAAVLDDDGVARRARGRRSAGLHGQRVGRLDAGDDGADGVEVRRAVDRRRVQVGRGGDAARGRDPRGDRPGRRAAVDVVGGGARGGLPARRRPARRGRWPSLRPAARPRRRPCRRARPPARRGSPAPTGGDPGSCVRHSRRHPRSRPPPGVTERWFRVGAGTAGPYFRTPTGLASRRPGCEHVFVSGRGDDPPRRPRLLLRVGGAARPSAAAQPRRSSSAAGSCSPRATRPRPTA